MDGIEGMTIRGVCFFLNAIKNRILITNIHPAYGLNELNKKVCEYRFPHNPVPKQLLY